MKYKNKRKLYLQAGCTQMQVEISMSYKEVVRHPSTPTPPTNAHILENAKHASTPCKGCFPSVSQGRAP